VKKKIPQKSPQNRASFELGKQPLSLEDVYAIAHEKINVVLTAGAKARIAKANAYLKKK
jgi:histidine ammonia-lyase